jgi:hypothetical protein
VSKTKSARHAAITANVPRRDQTSEATPDPRTDMVTAFREDAEAYCRFIDKFCAGLAAEPYSNLMRVLSNLAKSGAALPIDATAMEDLTEFAQIDSDRWQGLTSKIGAATLPARQALEAKHVGDEGGDTGIDAVGRLGRSIP